jgi:geranylgeranyl diphosphate synthase type II
MKALLDNAVVMGLGPALRTFHVIARMARETAEGQMVELQWIRRREWWVAESEYIRMVHKKTAWYSFIAPMLLGAIAANDDHRRSLAFHRFASSLGVAFQITDDLLNLDATPAYGKEHEGDLWEGKLTLMLLHALHRATAAERDRAAEVLARPRPRNGVSSARDRTADDVEWLRDLIDHYGGVKHARDVAADHAHRAKCRFDELAADWEETPHRGFIEGLITYVTDRDR